MPNRRRAVLILATLCCWRWRVSGRRWRSAASRSLTETSLLALLGREAPAPTSSANCACPAPSPASPAAACWPLAGALMQVLLRNPLADPYILGISGGAPVSARCSPSCSACGGARHRRPGLRRRACGAMLLVFGLAHGDGSWTQTRLLLTGVIVAAGCGAAGVADAGNRPRDAPARHAVLADGRRQRRRRGPGRRWLVLAAALVLAMPFARELNLLARGLLTGAGAGCAVGRLRYAIYPAGLAGDRRLGDDRGFDRLHRPRRTAPGAAGDRATTSACCYRHRRWPVARC
jgi:iron complex transport system permease protein